MSSTPIKLTEFEQYLLENVAKGKSKDNWNWHKIGILVTYQGRAGETDMMDGLHRLVNYGLAVRFTEDRQPMDHWELTPAGEHYLTLANKKDKS
jgi:hypothetical protein